MADGWTTTTLPAYARFSKFLAMTVLNQSHGHCLRPAQPPGCRFFLTSHPLATRLVNFAHEPCHDASELTLGENFTRNTGELVGKSVEKLIQLLGQLGASIVGRLMRWSVSGVVGEDQGEGRAILRRPGDLPRRCWMTLSFPFLAVMNF